MTRHVHRVSAECGTKHGGERGVALVALIAFLTIGLIYLMTILPAMSHVAKNEREKELLFRGMQIADAIGRYQQKFGAPPPSLEDLVKKKCLRKDYGDPMNPEGKWRIIRHGDPIVCVCMSGAGGKTRVPPVPAPLQPGVAPGGTKIGPIVGVASQSKQKSIRKYNGCDNYHEWIFSVSCQRDWSFSPPVAAGPNAPGAASGEPIHGAMSGPPAGQRPPQRSRPRRSGALQPSRP